MKKISTAATKQTKTFQEQNLTIGLERSLELVLRSGRYERSAPGAETEHQPEGHERGVRGDAAKSDRAGVGDAFALGVPAVERVGTRSDRCACVQRALDRGESEER